VAVLPQGMRREKMRSDDVIGNSATCGMFVHEFPANLIVVGEVSVKLAMVKARHQTKPECGISAFLGNRC